MRYHLAFLSTDTQQIERLQSALAAECAVMPVDPRQPDRDTAIRGLAPHTIMIDMDAAVSAGTALDRVGQLRTQFPNCPLIAIGDELSAQLILATFRAGADDFIDRDAADSEVRATVMARLREHAAAAAEGAWTALVSVLSPAFHEEDFDFALNIALALTEADKSDRVLFVDLSLPASPARTAIGLELGFTVKAAIQELARLDRTFLDAALACDDASGLRVLALSDGGDETEMPAVKDLALLLQVLRANFDRVVVYWGPFSRQALRGGADPNRMFVCCNQRLSSIRDAKALIEELRSARQPAEPALAIHQFDTAMVPSPAEIAEAVGAARFLALRATWPALAMAHNRGRPLILDALSHYSDALRNWLAADGLMPRSEEGNATVRLMQWLRRTTG
jgi:pilus assembly protein CpaE